MSKANSKYLNKDPDYYGPEFERYIVSSSFSGKDKGEIGVIKVTGRYFTDKNSLMFERPVGKSSHIYPHHEVYDDFDVARRKYLLEAVAFIKDYQSKINALLAGIA